MPDASFKDADEVFVESRKIKTREEIDRIRVATKATEAVITSAFESMREGIREIDLLETSTKTFMEKGCDWNYVNITAGVNAASVAHTASTYALKKGDVIRWDGGAVYGGYNSDVARNAVIGSPEEKIRRLHKALVEAQQKVIHAIRPGVKVSELFKIGIEAVRDAGYPKYTAMPGKIGHGVGLDIMEPPSIAANDDETLKPNMVLAIELLYFISGVAALQPEDMVRVTENGVEELSTLDRDLYVR